ncbi:hypothetical protein GCM10010451_48950 [Streptomyces virens]|uniref:Uncharacterized protein n=2 Tax=Streptomyces TaxID=1883 RepID=A0A514JN14_9ACTN|nr:hypothetical protein [Streptomyces calvus]MYS25941.1 hypothetical protein [Streptomyces sp. SID7804]MBA8944753.1 hypothetical protein [Streptomyces calvus]MBA8975114.1 hypothetical protein [Streptomyces calvus]QDI68716.1 hypothetical protein CD934_08485 [Streptomyces calvus]GGP66931.1 hypothetical protein GCM10010247_44730 [Streptomyces calvus]
MTTSTTGPAGGPSAQGPADGGGPSADRRVPAGRLRGGFGLLGPRHGRHVLSADQVDELALPIGDDGVIAGVDGEGRPAVLGVNRPTPYDIVLIGGLWTAQVLALRAAATGARVAVETGRPQAWLQMVHAMGGGQNGLAVHDVGRVPPQGASAGTPVLVVRDCGMRPPRGRVVSGPWQSVLTLLPYLSPVAPGLLRRARLAGIQRVSPDEAAELGRTMGLSRTEVESLPTLADGVTLWCADGDRQYVTTVPTDAETGLLGTPRRMD